MSADNSSSESPPTLRWKQGEIDGTIPLTKASGVRGLANAELVRVLREPAAEGLPLNLPKIEAVMLTETS